MAIDSLDPDSLKPLVRQLLGRIDELLAQNQLLLARIAELEAKLGQPPKTPTNSSLPPSRGQKANVPDAPRKRKGRKGRPGVTRTLCANPGRTREVHGETCACGARAFLDIRLLSCSGEVQSPILRHPVLGFTMLIESTRSKVGRAISRSGNVPWIAGRRTRLRPALPAQGQPAAGKTRCQRRLRRPHQGNIQE